MPKPGGDPSSGISLGDVLRRPKRHPACRRREAQPGSCTERENLIGDAKGKGASGANREAESTDAPARGGLLRSSNEAGVMPVERREQAIAILSGQLLSVPTGNRRNSMHNGRRQPSRGGTSRMMREYQVRICERLGVKFPVAAGKAANLGGERPMPLIARFERLAYPMRGEVTNRAVLGCKRHGRLRHPEGCRTVGTIWVAANLEAR